MMKSSSCLILVLLALVSVDALSMRHMTRGQQQDFPAIPVSNNNMGAPLLETPTISPAASSPAPLNDNNDPNMQLTLKEPAAASEHSEGVDSNPSPSALLAVGCSSGAPGCDSGSPTGRLATVPTASRSKDKLEIALSAIKQDIMVRSRTITEEKAWVAQVRKIVEQYNKKVQRVLADIEKTKAEVKVLFKKKKQIENLKIQRQLEQKLKDAMSDLTTLKSALKHVKTKASEFAKTKNEIKKTIISIHTQLAKLKGVKDPRKLKAIAKRLSKDE